MAMVLPAQHTQQQHTLIQAHWGKWDEVNYLVVQVSYKQTKQFLLFWRPLKPV